MEGDFVASACLFHMRLLIALVFAVPLAAQETPTERESARDVVRKLDSLEQSLNLPALVDLWNRSDDELRRLLKGSPIKRAKITGLRRNIAVAIGNSGDAEALDALRRERADQPSTGDPMVREHIDHALARLRPT